MATPDPPFLSFKTDGQPHEVFANMLEAVARRVRDTPVSADTAVSFTPTYETPDDPRDWMAAVAAPSQKGWRFKAEVEFLSTRPGHAAITYDPIQTDTLRDLLLLVGVTATESQVEAWTPEQRRQAENWAASTHLSASDNDVPVPPRPTFLAP